MNEAFKNLLLRLRGHAHLSQKELAKEINVHRNTIVNLENGRTGRARLGLVKNLADALAPTEDDRKALFQEAGFSVATWPVEIWWNVPSRDSSFTGREEVLQNLHQLLKSDNVVMRTVSLSGMAGVGKTSTAVEYVHRFQKDYKVVLWLPANSWEALTLGYKKLVVELGLPKQEEVDHLLEEFQRWLSGQHDWLLILDDIKDLQSLSQIVPTNHHGSVLVTTRILDAGALAHTHILSPMTEQDGTFFLLRSAKKIAVLDQANPAQREQAQKICHLMNGLPLALTQAGAYIRATGCSFSDYQELYTKHRQKLQQWEEKRSSTDHPSLTTTFTLIFDQVSRESQAATDLLRIFSFFAPKAIPEEIITQGKQALGSLLEAAASDQFFLNEAIEVLLRSSLVFRDAQERTFSIHPLIQVILQDAMEPEMIQEWAEKAVYAFSQMYIDTMRNIENAEVPQTSSIRKYQQFSLALSKDALLRLQRYLPHASICVDLIERWNMKQFQLSMMLLYISVDLKRCGYNTQAESFATRSFKIFESIDEYDHSLLASIRSGMGHIYLEIDQFEKAESAFKEALDIEKTYLGSTHPTIARHLADVASLYNRQGKYEFSEKYYKDALDVCQRAPNPDTIVLVNCIQGLAYTYIYQKKYRDAEPLLMQALAMLQHGGGQETSLMVTILAVLSQLYCLQDKYIQAEIFSRRALVIQEQYVGINHPSITESLLALALVFNARGKYTEAESLYMRVLELHQKIGEKESLFIAEISNNLATCYADQRKYAEAEKFLQKTLEIMEQKLEENHPHIIACLSNLAEVYYRMGEANKAIQLRQQIVALLSPNDSSAISHIVHLAQFHLFQSEWEEAEELYKEAESLVEKHMDTDRSYLATIYNDLGLIYLFQRRYIDAERYLEQALTLHRDVHGSKSLDTAKCLKNLVDLYNYQGWSGKALPLCEQALAIYMECEGPESTQTATCLCAMARIYHNQEVFLHAELLCQSALEIYEKALGVEHRDVAECLVCLAEIYTKQRKYTQAVEAYHRGKKILKQKLLLSYPQIVEIDLGLANVYLAQGNQEEAEKCYTKALEALRQTRAPNHLKIASTLNHLAELYFNLHRYKEAESYYLQAIDIQEHHLKDQETELVISHHNLAMLYSEQGKGEMAESHLLRALEVIKEEGNIQILFSARIKENLAVLYYEKGRYEQAEILYREALSIYGETIGLNHPETIQCLNNVAMLYGKLGRHQEALELFQRVTIILEQHPEMKQIDEITQIFENLALLYKDHEQMDNAEQVWKKALARRIQQDLDLDDDLEPIPGIMLQAVNDRQDRERFLVSLSSQEQRKYKEIKNTLLKVFQALTLAVEAFASGDHSQSRKIETILFYLSVKGIPVLQPTSEDERGSILDTIPIGKIELDMHVINILQETLKDFKGSY